MKNGKIFWGLLFIGVGLLFAINVVFEVSSITLAKFWPIYILTPGIVLELNYFITRKNSWTLIPGGILTIIGTLFFFQTFTNWIYMKYSWPIIILAVAAGLFQFYWYSRKPKKLLIPIQILAAVGLIAFTVIILTIVGQNFNFSIVIALIFLVIGSYILFKKNK